MSLCNGIGYISNMKRSRDSIVCEMFSPDCWYQLFMYNLNSMHSPDFPGGFDIPPAPSRPTKESQQH